MSNILKDERELLSKPGDTILETLEHIKMTQVELAERMGKAPSKINDIISGKEPITVTTALQLETVLGIDANFWLNREMLYREKLSRIEQEETLQEFMTWLNLQPIKELKQLGYIKSTKIGTDMASECLRFYGVVNPIQWETVYINHYASTNFRKSEAHQTALGSMAAWLRIGEIEMQKLTLPLYNKDEFKKTLLEIRDLVAEYPEDFANQLQSLCLNAGVGLVYTICLPKAPISGATRWIGNNPLIQLTDRYKTNDHFWFTFYHEVGHIMLHGKKEVFIENFEGYQLNSKKEIEADDFASKWLLPEAFINDLPEKITIKDVKKIASKYKTHAAIVIGRLHFLKKVPYSFGADLRMKVVLDQYTNQNNKK
jgi:addiction module HigA family antidote